MKKLIPILLILAFAVFVVYKLNTNKAQMEAVTSLAETVVKDVPVTIYQVQPVSLEESLSLSGTLNAKGDLMLMSTAQGRISRVFVEKGDVVRKGALIAQVEDELLREQMRVTETAYRKLEKDLERFRIMAENEAITQQQLEGIEITHAQAEAKYVAAKKQWEDTRITSPISGQINQLFVKQGALLGPGVPVCEIVNDTQLILPLKLSESEFMGIGDGDQVAVTLGASHADTLSGTVSFRSAKPDYSGQYVVEVSLQAGTESANSGMLASAHFPVRSREGVNYIPRVGLLGLGEAEQYVFIADNDTAQKRIVTPAEQIQDYVAVEGLKTGDKVIIRGNTLVREGQSITVK